MIPTELEIAHFLALYSQRNFTAAARGLNISQPALTQSIARLEAKLETKLFIRSKRGCHPAAAAEILYAEANRLNECWEGIRDGVSRSKRALGGKFRLGCHPSVGGYTLPQFFKAIAKAAPRIEIELTHGFSRKITEQIVRFELDFGFVVNPERHPDLVLTKLGIDRVCFWRATGERAIPRTLFSDLSRSQLASTLKGKARDYFSDWRTVETPSLELIRTLTTQGAGVGLLPERVAKADRANVEILEHLPVRQDEIFLAYRVDMLKSAAGKVLIEAARGCILN